MALAQTCDVKGTSCISEGYEKTAIREDCRYPFFVVDRGIEPLCQD